MLTVVEAVCVSCKSQEFIDLIRCEGSVCFIFCSAQPQKSAWHPAGRRLEADAVAEKRTQSISSTTRADPGCRLIAEFVKLDSQRPQNQAGLNGIVRCKRRAMDICSNAGGCLSKAAMCLAKLLPPIALS